MNIQRGARELCRLLQEQTYDLRRLELANFRPWLDMHLARWRQDPVFIQRTTIRELRRAHPQLEILEKEYRRVALEEAATPQSSRLCLLEQELIDTNKALAGLAAALTEVGPERKTNLQQKLAGFQAHHQALLEEQTQLIQSSPRRQDLVRISTELQLIRSTVGLEQEEACLEMLLKQQGRRSGRSGESFEELALTLTGSHIVPELLSESNDGTISPIRILRGVTLGTARTELDQVVIRLPEDGNHVVEVLAVVEVKRNINDLAHGFRRRQENLAWLIGAADRYDPRQYRTRSFPTGHFDRESAHKQDGELFFFGRASFRRFRCEPSSGLILDSLYFITRAGNLWGVSNHALARIHSRVAQDERWAPEDDSYLGSLLRWCQRLAEPIETPDLLRMYASTAGREHLILVVGR
jgi:hypothetical protein